MRLEEEAAEVAPFPWHPLKKSGRTPKKSNVLWSDLRFIL
jgi:hypothetical protein